MEQVYADADVLVFPSLVGGIGLVCYEAMATALPVITSDGDVVIRDGLDGLSIPLADLEQEGYGDYRKLFEGTDDTRSTAR